MAKARAFFVLAWFVMAVITPISVVYSQELEDQADEPKRAAIFVKNRAGDAFAASVSAFEDLLIAEVANMGFRVISRDVTIQAVSALVDEQGKSELDELLESRSSATRLAQNMGADYLFFASLTAYGSSERQLNREDLGLNLQVVDHKLTASYRFIDLSYGDAVSSGSVTSSQRVQNSSTLMTKTSTIDSLITDAARQIGRKIRDSGGTTVLAKISRPSEASVSFSVIPSIQDMTVPEVVVDEKGNLTLGANRYQMEPLSVTVELDGVVIGTTPGPFEVSPGIHTIRLSREGFRDWQRTINVKDGQTLGVALTLSDEGRSQWFAMANFFADLKSKERASAAEAEQMAAFADFLRNSEIKINVGSANSLWN